MLKNIYLLRDTVERKVNASTLKGLLKGNPWKKKKKKSTKKENMALGRNQGRHSIPLKTSTNCKNPFTMPKKCKLCNLRQCRAIQLQGKHR